MTAPTCKGTGPPVAGCSCGFCRSLRLPAPAPVAERIRVPHGDFLDEDDQ